MIFQYLNFHTCYSCTGTVSRELGHDCCFRYITKENPEVEMDNHYHILFHKTTDLIECDHHNNFCPFDEKEIIKYLNMLRAYCPFTYVLSSTTLTFDDEEQEDEPEYGKTYDVWALDVHITGNLIYHKFILTQIRLLYEHPFNVALMDTKRLRTIEGFSKFTSLNLYSMVISVIGRFSEINALDDQCFCRLGMHSKDIPKFKSLAEYRAKLKTQEAIANGGDLGYDQARLFNIHDYAELPRDLLIEIQSFVVNTYGYDNRNIIKDLEYWEDPKKFNDRLALYTKVLPYFRK